MDNQAKQTFRVFNFGKQEPQPVLNYNKQKSFIEWGQGNNYPDYLLEMYSYKGSGTHKAIINRKVAMIAGQGFENGTREDNALALRIELDYEIYNGFAIEVIYANDGSISEMNHIPYRMIRKGIETDEHPYAYYWVSTDWTNTRKHKPQAIREWNGILKQGSSLFYYSEYNPSSDIYPVPYYSNETNWIELDWEISNFHLNQAKRGYHSQFILNFATGIPNEEEMDDFVRSFRREYQGTDGENMIITWSDGTEQRPELIPIQMNDSDQRFLQLSTQIRESIFVGHSVVNPTLFGIQTPGQLGGRAELAEALQIFQMTYVSPRQRVIESSMTEITGNLYTLLNYQI